MFPFLVMTSHRHHAWLYPTAPRQTVSILRLTAQPTCSRTCPLPSPITTFTGWSPLLKCLLRGSSISGDFPLHVFASRSEQPTSSAPLYWPATSVLLVGTDHHFSLRCLCHPTGSSRPEVDPLSSYQLAGYLYPPLLSQASILQSFKTPGLLSLLVPFPQA